MRQLPRLTAVALLAALPLSAQEAQEDGPSLMEQGAQLFLRGLLNEMEPGLNELQGLAEELGPALEGFAAHMGTTIVEIMRIVDDIENYEQPEFLPNGDILIRRKPDAPLWEPPGSEPGAEPGEEIEL